jgi:hypothetical protein
VHSAVIDFPQYAAGLEARTAKDEQAIIPAETVKAISEELDRAANELSATVSAGGNAAEIHAVIRQEIKELKEALKTQKAGPWRQRFLGWLMEKTVGLAVSEGLKAAGASIIGFLLRT